MPMLQCGNVVFATASVPLLLSQPLSLPLSANPTVSVVTPVPADSAFGNAFDIGTIIIIIATYTGADVTIVGKLIEQNNPTFSAEHLLLYQTPI